MKHVIYHKREILNKGRVISIREMHEDKECVTRVRKNFVYFVNRVDAIPEGAVAPQIRMFKEINSDSRTESFIFKVKGIMHIKEKRFIYAVEYCHSLFIRLYWKSSIAVPKPVAMA